MDFRLAFIDYLIIGLYLVLMLGIGALFTRRMKGGSDFFVGGRRIPWWVAGISLYMTLFSAWTFTGAASFTYNTGWFGVIAFCMWPLALLIGFLLTASRWRKARIVTPVEYVQTRFNAATHRFLAIVLIISSLYWPAHHLASLSKITAPAMFPNSMVAIDATVVVVGLIILLYTFGGGLWAVAFTDFVQFMIFIAICGVLIPVCFASGDLGGSFGEFLSRTPDLEWSHTIRGTTNYSIWYLIGLPVAFVFSYSSGGNVQRYFSVRDEKAALKTGWLAFGLFAMAPLLFGLPPLIGKVLWPELADVAFFAGITKPDENIFIAVVLKYMPAGMVGLFLAAMMSASMSAMDSAWNAVSAMVSIDIYKNMFKPDATEKETLLVGRITIVLLALIAIVMALMIIHSEYGVFTVSNIFLGLIGIPVTVPLFLGVLWRDISRWSAISSVLAGTVAAAAGRFLLHLEIGPQYIVTVGVTLLVIAISNRTARLRLRNPGAATLATLGLTLGAYLGFLMLSSNPELRAADLIRGEVVTVYHGLLLLACGLLFILLQKFNGMYARDLREDQTEVDAFFSRLATPVDVEKELGSAPDDGVRILPMVARIAFGLAAVSLLMLISADARTDPMINVAVAAVLAAFGAGAVALGRRASGEA